MPTDGPGRTLGPAPLVGWLVFTVAAGSLWYTGVALVGLPTWVPEWAATRLDMVPGIRRHS